MDPLYDNLKIGDAVVAARHDQGVYPVCPALHPVETTNLEPARLRGTVRGDVFAGVLIDEHVNGQRGCYPRPGPADGASTAKAVDLRIVSLLAGTA